MGTIANGKNRPINVRTGTVPDVSGALQGWYQPMVFERVTKTTTGFQLVETGDPISFRGVVQPFTERQLLLKPEGQRAWTWLLLHADPVLTLNVDEVVLWLGVQTRIMSRKNFALYGYVQYHLVQDWEGSGPTVGIGTPIDGGDPYASGPDILDGGNPSASGPDLVDGGTP